LVDEFTSVRAPAAAAAESILILAGGQAIALTSQCYSMIGRCIGRLETLITVRSDAVIELDLTLSLKVL